MKKQCGSTKPSDTAEYCCQGSHNTGDTNRDFQNMANGKEQSQEVWHENKGTFQSTKKNNNCRIKPPGGYNTRNRPTTLNETIMKYRVNKTHVMLSFVIPIFYFLTISVPIVSQWVHPEMWKVKPLLLLLAALCVCKKHCQGNKPFVMSPRGTNTFPWSAITPALLTYCGDKMIGMTTNNVFFSRWLWTEC